jgi:predicted nucleotidyltransferase
MQLMDFERTAKSVARNACMKMNAGDIARMARPVFERHNVERAILFGSFATGRQSRKSDVDLILVKKTTKRYFERFETLLEDLYRAIPGREIECFIYTPQELASISHRVFIRRAMDEGTVIYERG